MIKTWIIILLVLIIIGLYFAPQVTKVVLKKTGQATVSTAKDLGEKIAQSDEVQGIKEKYGEEQPQQPQPEQKQTEEK